MNQLLDDIRKDAIKQAKLNKTPNDEELSYIYKAIGAMLLLAEFTRNEGLLSVHNFLESAIYSKKTDENIPLVFILKKIGELIVDGAAPEFVEEIVTNIYWRREFKGYEALIVYIYARGILMIQQDVDLRVQEKVYHSLLDTIELVGYELSEYKWAKTVKSYKECRISFIDDKTQDLVDLLNELYVSMSDDEFKQFVKSVSHIAVSLPYLTDEAEQRLFANVSERLKICFIEDVKRDYQYINEKMLQDLLLLLIGKIAIIQKTKD